VIGEDFSSAFQLFEYPLGDISIPVGDVLKSERVARAGRLQPRQSIDKEDHVVDETFLVEFREDISESAEVLVGNSRTCSRRSVSGSTATNSQYRWLFT